MERIQWLRKKTRKLLRLVLTLEERADVVERLCKQLEDAEAAARREGGGSEEPALQWWCVGQTQGFQVFLQ